MRVVCLAWAQFSDRLDELALALGGSRRNFHAGYLPKYLAPLKYAAFFLATGVYLAMKRPDVVYAQNPPVFCPIACLPYSKLAGKPLLVDHHNIWSVKVFGRSAFTRLFSALERFVARSAFANTVPHVLWKRTLESMSGARVMAIHDYVPKNPFAPDEAVRMGLASSGLVGVASGHQGHPLERVEVEALAAEASTGVTIAVTGPPARLAPRMERLGSLKRVKYLGYLQKGEYERLKASCDFGLNINDEPYTVNHVLYEYAAASLAVISIRRPEIESVFGDSLLYVERSDVSSVSKAIAALSSQPGKLSEYRARMARKFGELSEFHAGELASLRRLITTK